MAPRASIIIPVLNRWDLTRNCLQSIAATTGWSNKEVQVVVVDNGSDDSPPPSALPVDVYLRNFTNLGFAKACNQGTALASSPTVVFLNNDTEVRQGWLDCLLPPLEDGSCTRIAGSRLVWPDGRLQHAGVRLFRTTEGILTAENIDDDETATGRVEAVTGACMAVNREWFLKTGSFDEGYWNGYEDVDLCLRARWLAQNVVYVAESNVMHICSASGPSRWERVQENIDRLQQWGDLWIPFNA